MVFRTKNSPHFTLHFGCKDEYIQEMVKKDFLHLQIDNHLNWKTRTGQVILKLNAACYSFQSMVHISKINTLKLNLLYILSLYFKTWNNCWE